MSRKDLALFSRVREIRDPFGMRLRVSVERHPRGAVIALECSDVEGSPRVLLDDYGAELLSGYILSARLALPGKIPDEVFDGSYPSQLRLTYEPEAAIEIDQAGESATLSIPSTFWDRLYAELFLVVAHARELGRRAPALLH